MISSLLWSKSLSLLEILWLILFAILVIVIVTHFQFLWKYRSLYFKIPGLPIMPIVGSVIFLPNARTNLLKITRTLAEKYGPVYRLKIGRSMLVVISDRDMTDFFLKSRKYITKAAEYHYLDVWLGNNGILNADGEQWQKTRKMGIPALNSSILAEHLKVFDSASDVLIDVLYGHADKSICDINPILTAYTLDIISETAMGIKINSQRNPPTEYIEALHFVTSLILKRVLSIYKWSDFLYQFTSDYRKEQKYIKILDDLTVHQIAERKKYLAKKSKEEDHYFQKKSIYLDILLQSTASGQPISDEEIKIQVNNFTFGGHDTTGATISFLLYELANNAEVQNKILEEVKLIFGKDKNCHCTMQDLNEMKYTEMVIKEVLRYYTPVPFIGRRLKEEVDYNGIIFPKGTTLMFMICNMHKDPVHFEDPYEFKPERFHEDNTIKPYTFIPFSAGPRNCIGQKYGMLEMKATVARLIRHFEFLSAGPEYKMKLTPDMVMKSCNGVNIRLRPRN